MAVSCFQPLCLGQREADAEQEGEGHGDRAHLRLAFADGAGGPPQRGAAQAIMTLLVQNMDGAGT